MDRDYLIVLLRFVSRNETAMAALDAEGIDDDDTIFIGDEIRRAIREEDS